MGKAVRMADIAERLDISVVSVSKALAGKPGVSEEMRTAFLMKTRFIPVCTDLLSSRAGRRGLRA